MKRFWVILVLGVILGAGTYGAVYMFRTNDYRELCESLGAELAWLKKEFHLSDTTFKEVKSLHDAYKPVCAEMCRRIEAKNEELARLLVESEELTPEIEEAVQELALLTRDCQLGMLEHFFQVSRVMPPEQGRKYLVWMQQQTLMPSHPSMTVQIAGTGYQTGHDH